MELDSVSYSSSSLPGLAGRRIPDDSIVWEDHEEGPDEMEPLTKEGCCLCCSFLLLFILFLIWVSYKEGAFN